MTSPLNRNIAALTLSVQCETTWLRLRNALNGVQDALRDEKYRADQLFQGSRCRTGKPVPLFLTALLGHRRARPSEVNGSLIRTVRGGGRLRS